MLKDQRQRNDRGRLRTGPLVVGLVLLLVACGGSDTTSSTISNLDPAITTAQSLPGSDAAAGGLQDQTFTVEEHFWHSGFRVEINAGEITSTEDQLSGRVTHFLTLLATLENLGSDTGYFGPSIAIATTNNSYPYTQTTEIPDVPGGLKSQATFTFLIDDGFTLAGAELIVGDPTQNQARVSLDGTTGAVRLEPTEPPVSGMLTMELIDLAFTRATVRYDLPDRHREVQQGKQALTLYFDAVSRKGGNWQVFATDFALILPDGTAIGPEAIDIGSLPGSAAGVATPDRYVQFLVDEDPGGDYTLRLTPGTWFIGDDGVTEATFEFSLP